MLEASMVIVTVSSFSVDVSSVELKVIVLEVSPEAKLIVVLTAE